MAYANGTEPVPTEGTTVTWTTEYGGLTVQHSSNHTDPQAAESLAYGLEQNPANHDVTLHRPS